MQHTLHTNILNPPCTVRPIHPLFRCFPIRAQRFLACTVIGRPSASAPLPAPLCLAHSMHPSACTSQQGTLHPMHSLFIPRAPTPLVCLRRLAPVRSLIHAPAHPFTHTTSCSAALTRGITRFWRPREDTHSPTTPPHTPLRDLAPHLDPPYRTDENRSAVFLAYSLK